MRTLFAHGGRLIDSSPMYGSSQPVIGHALARLRLPSALFSAEKVWIGDATRGAVQIEAVSAAVMQAALALALLWDPAALICSPATASPS